MRNVLIIICAMFVFAACTQAPDAQQAQAEAPRDVQKAEGSVQKAINLTNSSVKFVGTKPTGRHEGIIPVSSGHVDLKDGKIAGGKFVMDISGLKITDLQGESAQKLAGHLLSADFFEAEKFPKAVFQITNVIPNPTNQNKFNIVGNLTMKEATKSVSFEANCYNNAGKFKADANFNIDRTQWGMSYGNDKSLGDRFINPLVNLQLAIESE